MDEWEMSIDQLVGEAARFQKELQAFVCQADLPGPVVLSALTYELTRILALVSNKDADIDAVLALVTNTMKRQIAEARRDMDDQQERHG